MKKSISFLLLLSSFLIHGQTISFADANFKNSLVNSTTVSSPATGFDDKMLKVDANSDGEIQISEALLVKSLSYSYGCGPGACAGVKIGDFQGLTSFSNLEVFSAWGQDAAVLDLKNLSHLKTLKYSNNGSAYIDYNFTGATNLEDITVYRVGQSVDFTGLINLKKAIIISNNLTTLDLRSNTNLESFQCEGTVINKSNLININFDGLSKLKEIYLFYCKLSNINSLSLNGLSSLKKLYCRENNITNLNLSSCTNLEFLDCRNNLFLESIFLKNGKNEYYISLEGNPNLRYICQDQDNVLGLQQYVDSLNYTNCLVSSFCSFNPGGVYYTVQGGQKFDFNNNGCDTTDNSIPNVKYFIDNGSYSDYIISTDDGKYHVDLPAGNFSMRPSFENPSYYTSNPAILNVSFPTQSSPFTQDFCITANGAHPDLEVAIIPIQQARPGFDATYKIIVKNKGTIPQSGTLNLTFDDAILDFVSSNPTLSNELLNVLSWDFSNLNPFETKTINLVLNLNSPLETPPVNMGDVLHFSASVTSAETDETPQDNTFDFNQTVVNSFDPNDITCLEGETVPFTDKDFYLHYIVRFENTGNYTAQNIVVEDIVEGIMDPNVYDLASLVPVSSSHPFYTIKKYASETGITSVHFIFENINLPFSSGSNTGYIAFKIKTKHPYYDFSKSIWNHKANIHFDYNYPIKTNMVSTTMRTLSSQDFTDTKKIAFYPNPANDKIYFNQVQKSVTVFTIEGKKMKMALKNKEIDISELPKGVYLLQINTLENTVIAQKLIKN